MPDPKFMEKISNFAAFKGLKNVSETDNPVRVMEEIKRRERNGENLDQKKRKKGKK